MSRVEALVPCQHSICLQGNPRVQSRVRPLVTSQFGRVPSRESDVRPLNVLLAQDGAADSAHAELGQSSITRRPCTVACHQAIDVHDAPSVDSKEVSHSTR